MYETYETETYESLGETEMPGEWEYGEGEAQEGESESLEAELVAELMEISSEEELDRFLGKLASSVVKGASKFVKSPIGKALGGVLKKVAKTALPAVGGALGSLVLPGVGSAIGSRLGSMAGGLLEAEEAESMGEVEAEYEAAQRYVQFARSAYSNAARAPRGIPPRAIARAASISAARRYAPALLRQGRQSAWRQRSGRYQRQRSRPTRSYYEPPVEWWSQGDPGDGYAGASYDGEPDQWSGDDSDYSRETGTPGRSSGSSGPSGPGGPSGRPRPGEGRWIRRGNRIVLFGV